MENTMTHTKELVLMGLMIAIIYVAGSIIKIPSVGGFVHIGDCMVFLSVVVLGKKKGAVASAIGMMLVDLLGGYYFWAPFTFVIKGVMAYISGLLLEVIPLKKTYAKYIISFIVGAIFMVFAYFLAGIIVSGFLTQKAGLLSGIIFASKDIIGNIIQSGTGVVLAFLLSGIILKAKSSYFN
ncbi:ECF transporter S component [Clostridium sp. BJN0001]|uniref:ECF transporter S component n=1 Tax=Clostridium sp. BJN0001 TaxID=2930219 RepID=UPI001FD10D15|nr:ECF transporter S component [Clostridium sp. BJN0001]